VLRALRRVVSEAAVHGREVSVCGEMASDAAQVPHLLGLGIRVFSVDPKRLPSVQKLLQGLTLADAEARVRQMIAGGP